MLNMNRLIPLASVLLAFSVVEAQAEQKPFNLQGIYLEGCSCSLVCACALTGEMAEGCQVMGALIISSGNYGDIDLSDTKLAFAFGGGWVRIFVQSKDSSKAEAVNALGRKLFRSYGKVESTQNTGIDLSGSDGNYTLKVEGGKIMTLTTQPVLGADKRTAVVYTNYPDPLFHTIMQGRVVAGTYNDGQHRVTLEGTNSFFNQKWSASGEI